MRRPGRNAICTSNDIPAGVPGITTDMAARRRRGRKSAPQIPPEVPLSSARTAGPIIIHYIIIASIYLYWLIETIKVSVRSFFFVRFVFYIHFFYFLWFSGIHSFSCKIYIYIYVLAVIYMYIFLLDILYICTYMHICIFFRFSKLNWIGLSVGIVECGAAEN